jgi:Transposase DDE domain
MQNLLLNKFQKTFFLISHTVPRAPILAHQLGSNIIPLIFRGSSRSSACAMTHCAASAGSREFPTRAVALRKQLPEPVFGQIKQARGFRQFLMRGLDKVKREWAVICTVHNILKLAQGRSLSAAGPMTQKARLAAA